MPSADARTTSVSHEIARLAGDPRVHAAFAWFLNHSRQIAEWQLEVTRVPAPPFDEHQRAAWMRERFVELGLEDVHTDTVGNVLGVRRGADSSRFVLISAHLDTVFPAGTPLEVGRQGTRLFGPGISDNGCGLVALLATAAAFRHADLHTELSVLFVANVGEEGEGDLRGIRHLFYGEEWRDRIAYTLVIDGGGSDTIVTEGLGSRRFIVDITGPGGHSWSDFGIPNPIVHAARIIDLFSRTEVPQLPKTTFNIGNISGGTSINAIPESASFKVDIRSAAVREMDRVERALRAAVTQAQSDFAQRSERGPSRSALNVELRAIGNRPAAELAYDARILEVARAVDVQFGIGTRLQRASTDANIPLALGREAITLGGGGTGGGAHTVHEWYDINGRELGLKRILMNALALAGFK